MSISDNKWYICAYRYVCKVDLQSAKAGQHTPRFIYDNGTEEQMKELFDIFKNDPEIMAIELSFKGKVEQHYDKLLEAAMVDWSNHLSIMDVIMPKLQR